MKIIVLITFLCTGALVAGDSAKQEVSTVSSDKQKVLLRKAQTLLWEKGDCPDEVIQFVKQGLHPNYAPYEAGCFQESIIETVVRSGKLNTLKALVRHGANINAIEETEADPIIWKTIKHRNLGGTINDNKAYQMASFLIESGADLYTMSQHDFDSKGNTLFMYTCSASYYSPKMNDLFLEKDPGVAPSSDMYTREVRVDTTGNQTPYVSFKKWEDYLLTQKTAVVAVDKNFVQTQMKQTEENFNKYYTIDADGKVAKKNRAQG